MGASCETSQSGIGVTVLQLSQIDGLMTITINGTTAMISILVPGGGLYYYDIWLSDSATDPSETVNIPTSNLTHFTGSTNSDGEATILIPNTTPQKSWYAFGWFQKLNVSAVITVGT